MPQWVTNVVAGWLLIGNLLISLGLKSALNVDLEFVFSQEFVDATLIAVGVILDYLALLKSKALEGKAAVLSFKSKFLFAINPLKVNVG